MNGTLYTETLFNAENEVVSSTQQKHFILADKAYIWAPTSLKMITPKKNSIRGSLTFQEIRKNCIIASDRIITENGFGRMCKLWNICSNEFKWAEPLYDDTTLGRTALTEIDRCQHTCPKIRCRCQITRAL